MLPRAEERRRLAGQMLLRGAAAIAVASLIWYAGTDLTTRAFYDEDFGLLLLTGVFAIVVQLGVLPIAAWAARSGGRWFTGIIYLAVVVGFLLARVKLDTAAVDWLQEILASLLYFLVFLAGLFVIGPIAGPGWRERPEDEEDAEA